MSARHAVAWLLQIGLVALIATCDRPPSERDREPDPDPGEASADPGRAREALRATGITSIRWGLTPYLAARTMEDGYRPIAFLLAARLGLPVTLVVGDSYEDMQRQVIDGEVDVAVLPPLAYVQAKRVEPGLTVFATHVAEGALTYGSYIVARDTSGITSVEGLRGRRFAFVDQHSTSGWLFPSDRMLQAGLDPVTDIEPIFVGAHDAVFDAVADGLVEAGALYGGALASGRQRRPNAPPLQVIAKGRRLPHDAYVVRPGFPPEPAAALAGLLSEISTRTPEGRRVLASELQINGFFPVDDSHFDAVREVEQHVRGKLGDVRVGGP